MIIDTITRIYLAWSAIKLNTRSTVFSNYHPNQKWSYL